MSKKSSRLSVTQVKFREHGYAYTAYLVSGRSPDGRRVRKQFRTLQEAEAWASTEEIRFHNLDRDVHPVLTRLSREQLLDAEMAFSRLSGKSSLVEAITFFLSARIPKAKELTMREAAALFLLHKKTSGVRERTLKQIRSSLRLFEASVGPDTLVHLITTADCMKFLAGRGGVAKTFNNYRGDLHSFFVYAISPTVGWHSTNPIADIPKHKVDGRGMPAILQLDAARKLMEYVESYHDGLMVPYFALALFAGIRTGTGGEIWKLLRSNAEDRATRINVANGTIHIQPVASKTREYRQIKIQPNLADWLTRYPIGEWPMAFDRHLKHIRRKFELGHDVLRHTFISQHVAAFGSIEQAALQAGIRKTADPCPRAPLGALR